MNSHDLQFTRLYLLLKGQELLNGELVVELKGVDLRHLNRCSASTS